ncbi:hypothetical protein EDD15DRAFT_2376863 [Pisolithus albus]|nr:hypothetical protein EDD15DRAFT_2376863 [Pisolithus albus]
MPTVKVAVGYIIEQDVMNRLLADINIGDFEAEVAEAKAEAEAEGVQVTILNPVICKVTKWKNRLTPEQQARIPEVLWCVRNNSDNLDHCSFFVRTRYEYVSTREEVFDKLRHFESDVAARQRFMDVFGRGIKESDMKFATRKSRP